MSRSPVEMIRMMTRLMGDEGCVTIEPHPDPFRRLERDFLEGIRRCPATIGAPPGVNPYSAALGKPGRWLFVWIPDEK